MAQQDNITSWYNPKPQIHRYVRICQKLNEKPKLIQHVMSNRVVCVNKWS